MYLKTPQCGDYIVREMHNNAPTLDQIVRLESPAPKEDEDISYFLNSEALEEYAVDSAEEVIYVDAP